MSRWWLFNVGCLLSSFETKCIIRSLFVLLVLSRLVSEANAFIFLFFSDGDCDLWIFF